MTSWFTYIFSPFSNVTKIDLYRKYISWTTSHAIWCSNFCIWYIYLFQLSVLSSGNIFYFFVVCLLQSWNIEVINVNISLLHICKCIQINQWKYLIIIQNGTHQSLFTMKRHICQTSVDLQLVASKLFLLILSLATCFCTIALLNMTCVFFVMCDHLRL